MSYISTTARRATIFVRRRAAIALLGFGFVANVVWLGFLVYFAVTLLHRLP
jgi:hypothetical protein